MAAQEACYLVTITAGGHRAPATSVGARVVVEKQPTRCIGAAADGRFRAFDKQFRGGTRDGGEQPLETFFSRDKLKTPAVLVGNQFIVALGNPHDLINWLGPVAGKRLMLDYGSEDGAEGLAEAQDLEQDSVDGFCFGQQQRPEPGSALRSDEFCVQQEGDEFVPGEVVGNTRGIREIEGQASGNERGGWAVVKDEWGLRRC
jgi:hypothetical protein